MRNRPLNVTATHGELFYLRMAAKIGFIDLPKAREGLEVVIRISSVGIGWLEPVGVLDWRGYAASYQLTERGRVELTQAELRAAKRRKMA